MLLFLYRQPPAWLLYLDLPSFLSLFCSNFLPPLFHHAWGFKRSTQEHCDRETQAHKLIYNRSLGREVEEDGGREWV